MEITTDIQDVNHILLDYSGAEFQIIFYELTHKRIALRLTLPNKNEILNIVGIGCQTINGKFRFSNASLKVAEETNVLSELLTTISDSSGNFVLTVDGGLTLVKGRLNEFGTSFDDFLHPK